MILVDASSNDVDIQLPTATGAYLGRITDTVYIKRIDGAGNQVRVLPSGTDTIDNGTGFFIQHRYTTVGLTPFGSGWWKV